MQDQFSRTRLLIGESAQKILQRSTVAVFGLGGVGGHAADAVARCGIGRIVLVDDDRVCLTNCNRQLIATLDTVGKLKTQVMEEHIRSINPGARVITHTVFCLPENVAGLLEDGVDYIIDAVDTVSAKLALAREAFHRGIPIISCMGAGNKLDPAAFQVADIYDTSVCPLCRVMRRELRAMGIPSLKVVYSKEPPVPVGKVGLETCRADCACPAESAGNRTARRQVPGSIAFVPAAAGLVAAGQAVRELIGK